jgi:hypothetical protein
MWNPAPVTLDLTEVAPNMIEAAVAVTTGRLGLDAVVETRRRLVTSDAEAIGYFRHALARQVAAMLLSLDPYVVAVYEDQDVPEAEELAAEPATLFDPLRLFVHVELRTPALESVVRALNEALADAFGRDMARPLHGYVEATIVDERYSRWLRPRAGGYRPAPILLAEREAGEQAPADEVLARLWR